MAEPVFARFPDTSKRQQHLKDKRDNRLKADLVEMYGINNIDAIDSVLTQAHGALDDPHKSYKAVLSEVVAKLSHPAEPKRRPPARVPDPEPEATRSVEPELNPESRHVEPEAERKEKRFYPVKPKERVFDEWAAVAHHLDEVNKEVEVRERKLMKERQLQYRQELEEQRREDADRLKLSKNAVSQKDKESRKKEDDFVRSAAERDVLKEQEKRVQAAHIMDENLRNKQRAVAEGKVLEQREMASVNERLKAVELEEHVREEVQRQNRGKIAHALKESYILQEGMKRQQFQRQKDLDRVYNVRYGEKLTADDKERQKFFDMLKDKQERNSEKEKLYKYFVQAKRDDQLKGDEEKQLRVMHERMRQESEKEQKDREARSLATACTSKALAEQLEYRKKMLGMKRQEDRDYAEKVKRKTEEEEGVERQKLEEMKAGRVKYREVLKKQIETTSKKRLFKDVMSEHEKKVNGLDLAAYENMDTSLHAKVIGVRDAPAASIHTTPSKVSIKNPGSDSATKQSQEELAGAADYELARRINIVDTFQPSRIPKPYALQQSPSRLLELAIQNMRDPRAEYMRNDTNNRAYGYRPVAQSQKPALNKSFDVVESSEKAMALNRSVVIKNPLAMAGKAQMGTIEPENKHFPRRESAAGASKRQIAKYDIITGKNMADEIINNQQQPSF